MADVPLVIRALRQAVQDLDRPGVTLGSPFSEAKARWLAQKLGFTLPAAYTQLLAIHDGASLVDPVFFSFYESLRVLVLYHHDWADPARFWPISGDGCGNYYCLDLTRSDGDNSPVVFFDTMSSSSEPSLDSSTSIPQFILNQIHAQQT